MCNAHLQEPRVCRQRHQYQYHYGISLWLYCCVADVQMYSFQFQAVGDRRLKYSHSTSLVELTQHHSPGWSGFLLPEGTQAACRLWDLPLHISDSLLMGEIICKLSTLVLPTVCVLLVCPGESPQTVTHKLYSLIFFDVLWFKKILCLTASTDFKTVRHKSTHCKALGVLITWTLS